MRMPIKLNRSFWPKPLCRILPASTDPRRLLDREIDSREFSEAVGAIKVGSTFKTTSYARYPKTIEFLRQRKFSSPPIILDVGASDGSASLSLMEAITFSHYYVTDKNIVVSAALSGTRAFFFDHRAVPILYTNKLFIIYNDFSAAVWPFGGIGKKTFLAASSVEFSRREEVALVNPDITVQVEKSIRIRQYDALSRWSGERVDMVVAANILNRCYFSEQRICVMLRNLRAAMNGNSSLLVVIDNRPAEHANIFRLRGSRFVTEAQIGNGCDVRLLVERLS